MIAPETGSPDCWYTDASLLPPESIIAFGQTLVVAPHPDDEVLGCGGVIALLRQAGIPVRIIIASDGAASHPGSKAYPPHTLAALRRRESVDGLALLGVTPEHIRFLGLPDGAIPSADDPLGRDAVEAGRAAVLSWPGVETALLPWRRDPHGDHRATWSLFKAALDMLPTPVWQVEYPIWSRVHPGPDDVPVVGEARVWRLDISPVQARKRAAILAHRSQTTAMIDDAQIAECLTEDVLNRFFEPVEPLLEVVEAAT